MRKTMMGLVRKGKARVRGAGFTITWDIDSRDRTAVNRVMFYLFGRTIRDRGRERVYPGFVHKEGVRYLGQSTVFVLPHRLDDIRSFLAKVGADYDVSPSTYPKRRRECLIGGQALFGSNFLERRGGFSGRGTAGRTI